MYKNKWEYLHGRNLDTKKFYPSLLDEKTFNRISIEINKPRKYNDISKRKNYTNNLLIENRFKDYKTVKHHITDNFIIYIPEKIHLKSLTGYKIKEHREKIFKNNIILILYPELSLLYQNVIIAPKL
jgi:hypothetical protein